MTQTDEKQPNNIYDQLIGPFHDTAGLARWWGVSTQEVADAASSNKVIACQLANEEWVYPTWQFTPSGQVRPPLLTLWSILREAADSWTCAAWLCSPISELEGRSASRWVTDGEPVETAVLLARADAERWRA